MGRVMADCRRFPSDSNCSLTIIGDEEEVVRAATEHAASVHGHQASAELTEQIRGHARAGVRISARNAAAGSPTELAGVESRPARRPEPIRVRTDRATDRSFDC